MKSMVVLAAALLLAPALASAQEDGVRGRWSVTFTGGAAVPAGGEFHEGGSGSVLGLATTVEAKNNDDVFDPGVGWRGGIGYGISRNTEIFGDFAWKRAESSELSVGNVASLDLRAAFGDYTSYGVDAGVRYHFTPDGRVNPYVAALAGFRRVDAIPARNPEQVVRQVRVFTIRLKVVGPENGTPPWPAVISPDPDGDVC